MGTESGKSTTMYGWYSAKQEASISTNVTIDPETGRTRFGGRVSYYLTPDNRQVEVTEVNEKRPAGKWDDYVSLGEVTRCIGSRPAKRKVK